jgi:hypothetical protein
LACRPAAAAERAPASLSILRRFLLSISLVAILGRITTCADSGFIYATADSVGTPERDSRAENIYLFALSPERFRQSPALQAIRRL